MERWFKCGEYLYYSIKELSNKKWRLKGVDIGTEEDWIEDLFDSYEDAYDYLIDKVESSHQNRHTERLYCVECDDPFG